ncbi:LysR family transcriptional regulator [Histidinibacterium lentulum]|uniref:LysR family transcriptional regulator n=1 Tax=Histidinibacterium lentulum TaxID=2480588 RepID=A0A3N2R6Z5_9RHOB|nr:LysR family transcriptional regulator [Histidinibacterium lentulum]ROU03187.1 LysR family transcriptional regulator [Histidinibacterium lentulum]
MSWRDLPSLAAMRAFESAARHGSFSAAARELNVTHAAIAQHVRALEEHFALPLMRRSGNGMTVTPEAQPLALALTEALGIMTAAAKDLRERDAARPLRIATTPTFAANWLMPRIGRFWSDHPDVALEIIPGTALADLRAEGIDIAIRYGRGPWPGVDSVPLMPAGHVAVGAPGRFAGRRTDRLSDLAGGTWITDRLSGEEEIWAQSHGVDLASEKVLTFDTAELAREAAKAGLGIALLPLPIVETEIAEGRLLALCTERDSAVAYHIVTRPGQKTPLRDTFLRWLRAEAAGS